MLLETLLADVIQAHWLQKRACTRVFESEMALATAEADRESPETVEEIFKRLQLMLRYKTTCENSFQRAFRTIEDHGAASEAAWQKLVAVCPAPTPIPKEEPPPPSGY